MVEDLQGLTGPPLKKSKSWIFVLMGVFIVVVILAIFIVSLIYSSSQNSRGDGANILDDVDEEVKIDCALLGDELERARCEQLISNCEKYFEEGVEGVRYCENYMASLAMKIAKETNDYRYCNNVEDSKSKDACYFYVASETGRIEICEEVVDADEKAECIVELPAVLVDISIDDVPRRYKPIVQAEEYDLYPKTELVHVTFNVGPGGSYSRRDEYHFAALDPAECDKIRGAESVSSNNDVYANCLKRLSKIVGDPEICNYIDYKTYEKEDCIRLFASDKNDVASCFLIPRKDNLEDEFEGYESYTGFSGCINGVIKRDPSEEGCELLSDTLYDNPILADRCYLGLVESTDSGEWCGYIKTDYYRDLCDDYAQITTSENCDEIVEVDLRDICYKSKALQNNDASYCGFISRDFRGDELSKASKEGCYLSILFDTEDITVCHGIENDDVMKQCYRTVNAYLYDGSDCDEIPDRFELVKAWCYATAANWYGQRGYCDKIDGGLMDGNKNIKEVCLS